MKASEMIAMLEANPKLKFENNGGQVWGMRKDGTHAGIISSIGFTPKIALDDNYELIQEPVTFMEAAQALSEGKTVRCNCNGRVSTYKSRQVSQIALNYILHGTWYIEPYKKTAQSGQKNYSL